MTAVNSSDIEPIRRTLALYCQLCDDGRFDEWSELFTTDATFSVMGKTYTGRADVKAFIEKGQPPERRGKHVCSNTVIDMGSDGAHATAATDFVFVAPIETVFAITSAGRYHDSFVREGDRWLFRSRSIVFLGETQAPPTSG